MFTYLDPSVRERLIAAGKLLRVNRDGQQIEIDAASGQGSISILGPIPLPLAMGGRHYEGQWYACVRNTELSNIQEIADQLRAEKAQASFASLASSMAVNSVLLIGDPTKWSNPLVRVHSSCLTGDVFGSQRCECGPQFVSAINKINSNPEGGMLIYMSGHEGRGIGLWAKAATYLLQDDGEDTYQANESLGLPADSRDFSEAAALLHYFAPKKPITLLSNNPKKLNDLKQYGIEDIELEKHVIGVSDWNRRYLTAKRDWGHALDDTDIIEPFDK